MWSETGVKGSRFRVQRFKVLLPNYTNPDKQERIATNQAPKY
jgi:hypothetical protein